MEWNLRLHLIQQKQKTTSVTFGILLGQVEGYNGNKHKSTLVGLSVNIAVMTEGYITANSENYLESFLT